MKPSETNEVSILIYLSMQHLQHLISNFLYYLGKNK